MALRVRSDAGVCAGGNAAAAAQATKPGQEITAVDGMIVSSVLRLFVRASPWRQRHRALDELGNVALQLQLRVLVRVDGMSAAVAARDSRCARFPLQVTCQVGIGRVAADQVVVTAGDQHLKLRVRRHRAPKRLLGAPVRRRRRPAPCERPPRSRPAIPLHRHPVAAKRRRWRIASSKRTLIQQVALVLQFVPEVPHDAHIVDDVLEARIFGGIVQLLGRIARTDEPRVVASHHLVAIARSCCENCSMLMLSVLRVEPTRVKSR